MKKTIIVLFIFIISKSAFSCDFLNKNVDNLSSLMGKKSKIYDGYRQGKCVLDNALLPLPADQREVIVKLIAKTYNNND